MVPTIRKAKINDLDFIDQLYVTNALDEVKQQFPKRTKDLILTDFKKHEKSRKKSFLINFKKMKKRGIKIFDWRCYSSNKFSIKLAEKLGFYSFAIGFRKKV